MEGGPQTPLLLSHPLQHTPHPQDGLCSGEGSNHDYWMPEQTPTTINESSLLCTCQLLRKMESRRRQIPLPKLYKVRVASLHTMAQVFKGFFQGVYLRQQIGFCFCFLTFYLVLEYNRLTVLWQFQMDSKGTQSYICMYPFSPKLPPTPDLKQQIEVFFLESVEIKCKSLSRVRLFATPWTIQSMQFSRPEYWSG